MAALTILSQNEATSELSLQQHLEIAPDLVAYNNLPSEGDSEPLMMAQPVPHQATDKKRVKVYELRENDWYDRGTGFCMATLTQVSIPPPLRCFSSLHAAARSATPTWLDYGLLL